MEISSFSNSIVSPSLKRVVAHWNAARGLRTAPSWHDIRPAALKDQLPIIWSYKYDPRTAAFTGRLAGQKIMQIFGKNFSGLSLADAQPPEAFPVIYELCKRVVMEPSLYRASGEVFRQLGRYGHGERIMLPLSSDGIHGDGILGATEYHYGVSAQVAEEVEDWFSAK